MTGDQTTTQRTDAARAVDDDRIDAARAVDDDRIDAVGWWQLVGLVVVGAGAPALYFVLRPHPVPWTAVVVLGLALAVVLPAAQVRTWSRRGGRAAVLATRRWVQVGSVPADVPDSVWRPRVERWAGELRRRRLSGWIGLVLAVFWGLSAVTGTPSDGVLAAVWVGIAVAGLGWYRGDVARAEQLLSATPRR
ncbi:hypothetical protein LQK89_01325 [Curtobacterium sp. C1]|uniref:hypothetical protein n=1 Tax=Curtobacterium TaxID=2034 RepID=UPI001E3FCFE7|nr:MULTISPECIES: hypothetical protein [Curtobacterium]MCS5485914.1 hypothetical protein [Curtobacterium flaccumfaciens pv. basellae]MDK8173522.1 hypothetical protein [Curtobacterium citreum]UFU14366.1 hypothetical protein LQK89_01325 [Curtobacterium sp. C1]